MPDYSSLGLGRAPEGTEWIIRNRDDGKIEAILFDNNTYRVRSRIIRDRPNASQDEPIPPIPRPISPVEYGEDERDSVGEIKLSNIIDLKGMQPPPRPPMIRPDEPTSTPMENREINQVDSVSIDDSIDLEGDMIAPLPTRRFNAESSIPPDLEGRGPSRAPRPQSELIDEQLFPSSSITEDPIEMEIPIGGVSGDIKKMSTSRVLSDSVLRSQKALGTYESPPGEIIITQEALKSSANNSNSAPYKLTINPNINTASITDMNGTIIKEFQVGTGDTTGVRYGKKFFSPVGEFKIKNKVPYSAMEGGYGPLWMGLSEKGYGLHGPHAEKDKSLQGGFENSGFISHGCLRFNESDILEIGEFLDVGSSVEILPYDTRPTHRGALRIGS
jgi:lipoprotein-anchoring transpeptidase ErfK/SrfK